MADKLDNADSGKPSPVFSFYRRLRWGPFVFEMSLEFLTIFRDSFNEDFFLDPAHDFSGTKKDSLVYLRAVVDRKVFTPAVIERLSLAFPNEADAVAVLSLSDEEIIALIRKACGDYIAEYLLRLMKESREGEC